jgi:rSAM/selenodomain-associated transferase 2
VRSAKPEYRLDRAQRLIMLSIVIPTLNAEAGLVSCLSALVPGMVDGLVRQVIIVDGGSTDRTLDIADHAGCDVIPAGKAVRGAQLQLGATQARQPWLLFLHADTVLEDGWQREVKTFIERVDAGQRAPAAAAFRFALDDLGFKPRVIEAGVALRCLLFRLPYGDQGLLIPSKLYRDLGGYKPLPLMEDVDLIRRLPRGQPIQLRATAVTSAVRYRRTGYFKRAFQNLTCLTLYFARVPLPTIQRLYER